MAESRVLKRITELRTELYERLPFYADILSHLDIVETDAIESAGTNGRVIYYNRRFMEKLTKGQFNYVMMHELFHVIMLHFKRDRNKDKDTWNIAADYVVNGLLGELSEYIECGYTKMIELERPPMGCFLDHYYGESVEELYRKIYVKDRKKRLRIKLKSVDLIFKLSDEEANLVGIEIEKKVEDSMKRWSKDGSSKILSRQLNILKKQKSIPWKLLLKRYLIETDTDEVSYDHPERKYLHMELILPGVSKSPINNAIDNIWAFIDTSGSIEMDAMNRFITELSNICNQFDSKINIGFWDTQMHEVYTNVSKKNITEISREYMGGTDANSVYDFLESENINPRVMLILTDGFFDAVDDRKLKKYRDKTIVVLSSDGLDTNARQMGKIAWL